MGSYRPQTFSGISPAQLERLQEKADAAGVEMSGPTGRASKKGVEVEWSYSEQTQELTVRCVHTPFFVRAEDVNAKLRSLVDEALSS